ncbi:MAG: 5-bromo-4-chloroindolyl phosphate hydrolysis family protein [Desulfovibrionaceae bacterium]|nr:5-bromo-4-chloroindolyl phosphate hydrolysis family protein [Desulfovibrionaceae bacterium]
MPPANAQPTQLSEKKFNLLQRILVHILGISIAVALNSNNSLESFLAYLGTICLLPRGNWYQVPWLINLGAGVIQAVLSFVLGVGIAIALFLGGCQSWLQRIFKQGFQLGWDWLIAPFALVGIDFLVDNAAGKVSLYVLGIIFGLLLLVTLACHYIYNKLHAEAQHAEQLKTDLARMQKAVLDPDFPKELSKETQQFTEQIVFLQGNVQGRVREAFAIIERIHTTVEALLRYLAASKPSQASGWAQGLLRSTNWRRQGQTGANEVQAILQETIVYLRGELRKYRSVSKDEELWEEKFHRFELLATELTQKAQSVPANLATPSLEIAKTTLEIVKNMREDPQDRSPGERFLDRYLVSVHKIIDEYVRLSQGPKQAELEEAFARSVDVIERMNKLFHDELVNLLQNDTINFNAEVEAIDAMLKMKGH